jgi:uncharacterized protein YjbJ (UPF0337 family)
LDDCSPSAARLALRRLARTARAASKIVGVEVAGLGTSETIARRNQEQVMNWDQIKADWKDFKGKARIAWGKLTNDDLEQIRGNREQLEAAVQRRYGIAKEDAQRQVSEWTQKLKQTISPRRP